MLLASKRAFGLESLTVRAVSIILAEGLSYSLLPLCISLLSTVVIPNCSLSDGLLFYIEIVPFTVLTAVLLGIAIGLTAPTNRSRILLVLGSWLLWFIVSLLPGYFGPQIFIYGWQYGYFPGLVWDEAMELQSAYWWLRLIVIGVAIYPLLLKKSGRSIPSAMTMIVAPLWIAVLIVELIPDLGIFQTATYIERELSKSLRVQNATLHYSPDSMMPDEVEFVTYEIGADLDSIRSFYHLPVNSFGSIDIYLYPSVAELYKYVGTRSASISKPWRSELHIAKENLQSLKHELVHVLLAPKGNLPFSVSYSTGITEGAAEAIEETYDGIRSLNELSSEILQMKLATGVSDILSFTGFASNTSSKSYVLAGAFSSYLISKYGPDKYLKIYSSLDYEEVYQKSLKDLEVDWLTDLKQHPVALSADDTLRTNYFFARRSIIMQPCLRRIGKLMKEARGLFHSKSYNEADSVYAIVIAEAGRADAIQGRVYSLLRLHKYKEALTVLDTTASVNEKNNRTGLHILRGDILFINGDSLAISEWEAAAKLKLNSEHFLAAFSRIHCLAMAKNVDVARRYFKQLYNGAYSWRLNKILETLEVSEQQGDTTHLFFAAKNYMVARNYESMGRLREGTLSFDLALQNGNQLVDARSDVALFYKLIRQRDKKYHQYW